MLVLKFNSLLFGSFFIDADGAEANSKFGLRYSSQSVPWSVSVGPMSFSSIVTGWSSVHGGTSVSSGVVL